MARTGQIKIPATYMRGGTSKGLFFRLDDLPEPAQLAGPERDALMLRLVGSPDPYGKHTDGMGGATSSTSKVVILTESSQPDHDVDYLFGQVAIDKPIVDWSGNCGNLTAAVGPFAIHSGLIPAERIPDNGLLTIRVWQVNIQKTIIVNVPVTAGNVQETGDFELDGVTFPAAEIPVEFCEPADAEGPMFPTGQVQETLSVPGIGDFTATLINAGIATIFLDARELGYQGTELQPVINEDPEALARFERIRAEGALRMGLIRELSEAETRQHTPKIAFCAPPNSFVASSGKTVEANQIDLNVRALSMGKLHHAMMGTAAVAIGTAAAIPGTLVNDLAGGLQGHKVTFGHPSGSLTVGAVVTPQNGDWLVEKVTMSRSARILMEGWVRVPGDCMQA